MTRRAWMFTNTNTLLIRTQPYFCEVGSCPHLTFYLVLKQHDTSTHDTRSFPRKTWFLFCCFWLRYEKMNPRAELLIKFKYCMHLPSITNLIMNNTIWIITLPLIDCTNLKVSIFLFPTLPVLTGPQRLYHLEYYRRKERRSSWLETGCKSLIIYLFSIESTLFKLGLLYLENKILGNVKLINGLFTLFFLIKV